MTPQDEFEEAIAVKIPERMVAALSRYVYDGIEPGSFLTNALENNLKGAVITADDENIKLLTAYMSVFLRELPWTCWGSRQEVQRWMKIGGLRGIEAKEEERVA